MAVTLKGKLLDERVEGSNRVGLVEFGGKRRTIYLDLVPDAHAGDYVWFHTAFATERAESGPSGSSSTNQPDSSGFGLDQLRAYRLLSDLQPEHLRKLLPISREEEFRPGEIIFRCGESSLFLHLIIEGQVSLQSETGREIQVLQAGDAMGWSALTNEARTHFQAVAISRVQTVAFPAEQLRAACKADPVMGYDLMVRLVELVAERLDALRGKLSPTA